MLDIIYQIAKADVRFLIEPTTGARLASMMQKVIAGELAPSAFAKAPKPSSMRYSVSGTGSSDPDQGPQVVKVIRIHGVMMMEDIECQGPGTETLGRMIQRADNDPNINAIVLDISTPGGESRYTETLANIVASTETPVVAFVNQMTASAGYWTASQADHIMLSGNTAEVGSIGTVLEYYDPTRHMDKEGFDLVQITASKSTAKRKYNFSQPTEEDKDLIRTEWLDPINEVFIEAVKSARPDVAESALTAEMFIGDKAIEAGLADSKGTLQDAIILAASLSQNLENQEMNKTEQRNAFQKGVAALRVSLGIDAPQVQSITDDPAPKASPATAAPEATAEDVATLQAQVRDLTAEAESLGNQLAEENRLRLAAEAIVTEQNTTLAALQDEVAKLGAQPAKPAADVIPATTAGGVLAPKGKYDPSKSPITQEALKRFSVSSEQ
jgi:ClpP class serine protease